MKAPSYYLRLQARWERGRAAEERAYRKEVKPKRARSGEVAATLEAMYEATGDAAYADAFKAMQRDGFDKRGTSWKWTPARAKNADEVCLRRMNFLVRRGCTLRHAAAMAAVELLVPGKTFESVVTRLETTYRDTTFGPEG
jgi:hypothetical protein